MPEPRALNRPPRLGTSSPDSPFIKGKQTNRQRFMTAPARATCDSWPGNARHSPAPSLPAAQDSQSLGNLTQAGQGHQPTTAPNPHVRERSPRWAASPVLSPGTGLGQVTPPDPCLGPPLSELPGRLKRQVPRLDQGLPPCLRGHLPSTQQPGPRGSIRLPWEPSPLSCTQGGLGLPGAWGTAGRPQEADRDGGCPGRVDTSRPGL